MAPCLHRMRPMKLAGTDVRQTGNGFFKRIVIVAGLLALAGCGQPKEDEPAATGGEGAQTTMKGYAAFGSQCGSGFNTDPKAVRLELWSCPINLPLVELAEPIQPLYLSANCAKKLLTIRSQDRSINVSWELMPDGTFYITQEGLSAKLKNDGAGNANCSIPLSADMWGQVDCINGNTDQAKIRFETVMWLGKGRQTRGTQCQLPSDRCYFHAITNVSQCI